MLETLTQGFRSARLKLQGKAQLTEDNISDALKDVRISLLEADVELGVVRTFMGRVRERALGEVVQTKTKTSGHGLSKGTKVTPANHFIKICHDELVQLMGPVDSSLFLDRRSSLWDGTYRLRRMVAIWKWKRAFREDICRAQY